MSDATAEMEAASAGGPERTLIRTQELAKAFGPTQALRRCSFELAAGEVHAVIGENGSGKSTLVKILTGVHRPDGGTILIPGARTEAPGSPSAALAAGIVAVFQEVLVVGPRSVLDNIWSGTDGLFRVRRSEAEKREIAGRLLTELLVSPPALDRAVEELSLSDRQAVAIVRALAREPEVLILDEATSALDVATRDRLFGIVRRIAAEGKGVIFISHRMDEIAELGDRITVMRSGETVATLDRGSTSMQELVRLMTGAERLTGDVADRVARMRGAEVLQARGLQLSPAAAPFDFDLHAGELVGIAGLEGHGQSAFLDALRGAGAYAGEVRSAGSSQRLDSPRAAAAQGIVFVPRERRDEAIFSALSIQGNFALPTLGQDTRFGLVWPRSSARRFGTWIDRLGIKLRRPGDDVGTLSGGNQQKVVVARWLAANPKVLLLNDPTRGVDIGAKRDIYDLLASLTREGMAVVMLSTEVDEHVELMDRVLVFREQGLFAEIGSESISRESLVGSFFGRRQDAPA